MIAYCLDSQQGRVQERIKRDVSATGAMWVLILGGRLCVGQTGNESNETCEP